MLREAIASFWAQDLSESELIVQDNASTDETLAVAEEATRLDGRIVYERNDSNLGVCENIRRALRAARGKYLVILGDDDILLGPSALRKFVDVFVRHPDVHFAYPNQIQMNAEMEFDMLYRHFARAEHCPSGRASFSRTWLKAIQIAGVALRRSNEIYDLYPSSTMLFPQIELVGRLVSRHASYGIADFLVAARAHDDQLGFHANRRQRIVGPERHGTIEILEIAARLNLEATEGPDIEYTANVLARSLATNLANERLRGTRRIATANVLGLMRRSPAAQRDPVLILSLLLAGLTPRPVLSWLRNTAKTAVRRRFGPEGLWFTAEVARQHQVAASRWGRQLARSAASTVGD